MAVSRRYTPEKPPDEACNYGLDYSFVIPPGVGIASGKLDIFTNVATPVAADADWTKGSVFVRGRAIYCRLSGGVAGKDYQLRWTATDTEGNVWPRVTLQLCAETS